MRLAGREDVDDAAADGELAVLVGRILAREAGVDEQLGEIGRRDVLARLELERCGEQRVGRAHTRQQRRRRRDDHPRGARARRHESARARAEVTPTCGASPRYGSTSCDGNGRTARSAAAAESPSSAARKKRDVGDSLLEVGVARDDVQDNPMRSRLRGGGDEQRLRGAVSPETTCAGTSIPLRATAVLRTARRFSEVAVDMPNLSV